MSYDYDEPTDVIGCFCTLLRPVRGCSEATVVGDLGAELIVRLRNKREVVVDRNDLLLYD